MQNAIHIRTQEEIDNLKDGAGAVHIIGDNLYINKHPEGTTFRNYSKGLKIYNTVKVFNYGKAESINHDQSYSINHGQSHSTNYGQAQSINHDQSYSINYDQSHSTNHDKSFSRNYDQAHSINHNQSHSTNHDKSFSRNYDQAHSRNHGQSSSINYDRSYSTNHDRSYSTNHDLSNSINYDFSYSVNHNQSSSRNYGNSHSICFERSITYLHSDTSYVEDAYDNSTIYILSGGKIKRHRVTVNIIKMEDVIIPTFDQWLERGYVYADGIRQRLISKKTQGDVTIYKVLNDHNKECYVVQRGELFSHGETIEKAIHDLRYKLSDRDTSKYEGWKLDDTKTTEELIQAYRNITGSCEGETKAWCERMNLKDSYTIKEVIELTEGYYKNDVFKNFFINKTV